MSPARLLLAFALAHVAIATWPGIDLAVSRLFWSPESGFALARSRALHLVRHAIWNATVAAALLSLLAWAAWLALGWRARVASRAFGYPAALLLLGPGLLVNGLLKTHWHRARPADVEAFGGEATFTPPFQMAGECARNCAFVSGEGAGAVALALAAAGLAPPSWRLRAALAAVAVLASGLRMATGRHFLSDVVFGAFLMAGLSMGLYRLMGIAAARRTLTPAHLRHDLGEMSSGLGRLAGRLRGALRLRG